MLHSETVQTYEPATLFIQAAGVPIWAFTSSLLHATLMSLQIAKCQKHHQLVTLTAFANSF
ncbi:MAG TPA: hypothetical protein VIN08_06835 [Ohtaekwangia sp.]|uniref:hypothetical protein n=1 Tax=Ohtaekwangia sp. TaxID=2066019 RepID=UPI002F93C7B0